MSNSIFVLVGPTAVGKTDIAIEIAEEINGEIISADSMQIYKYMDIGTAKPTKEEMKSIPHHMISIVEPNEPYNAALYQQRVKELIGEIQLRNKLAMIVGGTGLYVSSLINDIDFTGTVGNTELRDELKKLGQEHGNQFLYDKLEKVDIKSAKRIHPNDVKRVIRALEVFYDTGIPFSESGNGFMNPVKEYAPIIVGLTMDRAKLYERINNRVDKMMDSGLLAEVQGLAESGYTKDMVSMQGLGYKEMFRYLNRVITLQEAIDIIKQETRRFAKRQLTWFKRDERIIWFNIDETTDKQLLLKDIVSTINSIIK